MNRVKMAALQLESSRGILTELAHQVLQLPRVPHKFAPQGIDPMRLMSAEFET
jgi:hypothetical protein